MKVFGVLLCSLLIVQSLSLSREVSASLLPSSPRIQSNIYSEKHLAVAESILIGEHSTESRVDYTDYQPNSPSVSSSQQSVDDAPIVSTPGGSILGVYGSGFNAYKGIRYGYQERWTAPTLVTSWNDTYNATDYKVVCPQQSNLTNPDVSPYVTVPQSEDCLFLNVFTPSNLPQDGSLLPVMFWIHGGSYWSGWGGDVAFWGDYFANNTERPVVLVSINYRLGALGFLATPDLSGNYGILDQQTALQWVQMFISYFGGDPDNVTIFGQSAGGMSVTLHTVIPSSFDLYHSAIIESGVNGIVYRTPEEAYPYGQLLGELVGCNYTDIECLKQVSAKDLVIAQESCFILTVPVRSYEMLAFFPIVDGTLLTDQPNTLLWSGMGNPNLKSVAIGNTRNESLSFIPVQDLPYAKYILAAEVFFGSSARTVIAQYPPVQHADNYNLLTIVGGDWLFVCASRYVAQAFRNAGVPTYLYHFMHVPSSDPLNASHELCTEAVCHSAEIPYVFHSDPMIPNGSFTTDEANLSMQMLMYWAGLAYGESDVPFSTAPSWPIYDNPSNQSMSFDLPEPYLLNNFNDANCDMWDGLGYVF